MTQADATLQIPWYRLLFVQTSDVRATSGAVRILVGAAHRLAWSGPDEGDDRRFALAGLQRATAGLADHRPALSALIDWWLVAALGEVSVGSAWSIDRMVPTGCGEVLRDVLSAGGDRPLARVRRPFLLAAALDELEAITVTHPGKIAPAIRILKEANAECLAVVRAGREGKPPPADLRLAGLSESGLTSWASESQAGRHVVPGTPVWDHTTRSLRDRANLVDRASSLMSGEAAVKAELPSTWQAEVLAACEREEEAEVALALIADLLQDPGPRPVLEPAVEALAAAPADRAARPAVLAVAREAFAAASAPLPAWARETQAQIDAVRAEIDQLAGSASGDGAASLAEARHALGQNDLKMARDWLGAARDELKSAKADASLTRKLTAAQAQAAELAAIGEAPPPEAGDAEAWAALIEERFASARASLQRRLEQAVERGAPYTRRATPAVDPDVPRVRAALQRQALRLAFDTLVRLEERVELARQADDAFLGPELAALRDRIGSHPERAACLRALDVAGHRRAVGLDDGPVARELERWLARGATGSDAPPQGRGEVVGPLGRAQSTQRVFYERDGDVQGPYLIDGDARPQHRWQAVGVLPAARFAELFGRVDAGPDRWLVLFPPSLEELIQAGADIVDVLDDDVLAAWLARELDGCPPAEALAAWLRDVREEALPAQIRDARMDRLAEILGAAERLAHLKDRALAEFLGSPEGRDAIRAAAMTAVASAEADIREQVERRRQEIEATLAPLEASRHEVQERLDALRAEVQDAEAALADRKLALIARLFSGQQAPGPAAPAAPGAALATAPIRASRFAPFPMPPLPELVEQVAGDTWEAAEVANLLLSVATGRWTLLAGLPGVGKSTFVRSVLARIGHGAGTGRYLEMVVRRDWQDDTALFGFWHPTHHAWEPSSEGFVEHILRARDDAASGYGGVYPVLIEELNLASPEYYLARPISALEAADPTVRLYDPELAPANRDRYPATFSIPDSVRLLGTVNVDDTVERLSPRFLSRASVIWVEPRPDAPLWKPEDDMPQAVLRWSDLKASVDRREEELGAIDKVLRFLVERRVPGAPTARTRAAILRYLGASRGLLPRPQAEDLQILQRVLPPLRGVGPRWRGLLDELEALLRQHGWRRSADRALDLRQRGEELGDWYDFFHT